MTQPDTAQQYLTSGTDILDGMDAQTEDVVSVFGVEALRVVLFVVNDSHRRHVVHNVSIRQVEQVVTTVVATVPEIAEAKLQITFYHHYFTILCTLM